MMRCGIPANHLAIALLYLTWTHVLQYWLAGAMKRTGRRSLFGICSVFLLLFTFVCVSLLTQIDQEIIESRGHYEYPMGPTGELRDLVYLLSRIQDLAGSADTDAGNDTYSENSIPIPMSSADAIKKIHEIVTKCGVLSAKRKDPGLRKTNWNETLLSFIREKVSELVEKTGRKKRYPVTLFDMIETTGTGYDRYKRLTDAITSRGLYTEGPDIEAVLHDLAHKPVIDMEDWSKVQTSLKFKFTLKGGLEGIFKPKRLGMDYVVPPDVWYMDEMPRHRSEIAAFHLDRLLGWRRVPPTVRRIIDVDTDIRRYASKELNSTFFISSAGNSCFGGLCTHYCHPHTAVCTHNGAMEGSLSLFLPGSTHIQGHANPWIRSYIRDHSPTKWQEHSSTFCMVTLINQNLSHGRRLLDLIDMHIFDFLIGNEDRHHYNSLGVLKPESFIVTLDNDSGFGKPHTDAKLLLAPLQQCCRIRLSTLESLLSFTPPTGDLQPPRPANTTTSLAAALQKALMELPDLLTQAHMEAVERRQVLVLEAVSHCLSGDRDVTFVIIDDGY